MTVSSSAKSWFCDVDRLPLISSFPFTSSFDLDLEDVVNIEILFALTLWTVGPQEFPLFLQLDDNKDNFSETSSAFGDSRQLWMLLWQLDEVESSFKLSLTT